MIQELYQRRFAAAAALLVHVVVAAPGLAQTDADRAAARRLATAGVDAYEHNDLRTATDKLERAYELLKAPSVGLWLARALAKQGKLVAAAERYTEVVRLPVKQGDQEVQEAAKKDAATELEALSPQIPNLVVRVEGADASAAAITLDGHPLSAALVGEQQPIDPGPHHVEGQLGAQRVTADVVVQRSQTQTATLRFDAASSAPASGVAPAEPVSTASTAPAATPHSGSGRSILGWSLVGVGAAGILTGGIAGSLAISSKNKLDGSGSCAGTQCDTNKVGSELDRYNGMRTVSSIGFIAGGALSAAGIVVLLTRPRSEPERASALWLSVGAASVSAGGRF